MSVTSARRGGPPGRNRRRDAHYPCCGCCRSRSSSVRTPSSGGVISSSSRERPAADPARRAGRRGGRPQRRAARALPGQLPGTRTCCPMQAPGACRPAATRASLLYRRRRGVPGRRCPGRPTWAAQLLAAYTDDSSWVPAAWCCRTGAHHARLVPRGVPLGGGLQLSRAAHRAGGGPQLHRREHELPQVGVRGDWRLRPQHRPRRQGRGRLRGDRVLPARRRRTSRRADPGGTVSRRAPRRDTRPHQPCLLPSTLPCRRTLEGDRESLGGTQQALAAERTYARELCRPVWSEGCAKGSAAIQPRPAGVGPSARASS
jgi:hypothetical protein